jgi:hypothetical protein
MTGKHSGRKKVNDMNTKQPKQFWSLNDANRMKTFILTALLLFQLLATAQIAVTVTPPKVVGQKAVVQLKMKNNLGEAVKSARAVCFLLDDKGKIAGQSTTWVIGQNKISLESGATNVFNFVFPSPQPFATTSLTAKVSFSRIVMANGSIADVDKTVSLLVAP